MALWDAVDLFSRSNSQLALRIRRAIGCCCDAWMVNPLSVLALSQRPLERPDFIRFRTSGALQLPLMYYPCLGSLLIKRFWGELRRNPKGGVLYRGILGGSWDLVSIYTWAQNAAYNWPHIGYPNYK